MNKTISNFYNFIFKLINYLKIRTSIIKLICIFSIFFRRGLNLVTYPNGEVIPQDLQLYYWDNSAGRYKPVGTFEQIKDMPGTYNANISGYLDGFITNLGNVDNVVLYYN